MLGSHNRRSAASQRKRSGKNIRNISGFDFWHNPPNVMPALVAGIHVLNSLDARLGQTMLLEGFKRSEIKTSGARIVTVA
ncbi:MAG: hypothetical protein WCC50_15540, partial [Pseudolabrys sp.]